MAGPCTYCTTADISLVFILALDAVLWSRVQSCKFLLQIVICWARAITTLNAPLAKWLRHETEWKFFNWLCLIMLVKSSHYKHSCQKTRIFMLGMCVLFFWIFITNRIWQAWPKNVDSGITSNPGSWCSPPGSWIGHSITNCPKWPLLSAVCTLQAVLVEVWSARAKVLMFS